MSAEVERMKKTILRIASLVMLVGAIIFLSVALTHPELGSTFYIGSFEIGVTVWRVFYAMYALTMIGMLIASFFVDKNKP